MDVMKTSILNCIRNDVSKLRDRGVPEHKQVYLVEIESMCDLLEDEDGTQK